MHPGTKPVPTCLNEAIWIKAGPCNLAYIELLEAYANDAADALQCKIDRILTGNMPVKRTGMDKKLQHRQRDQDN
jgi:hypothetical protein